MSVPIQAGRSMGKGSRTTDTPDVSAGKHRIEFNSLLKERLRPRVILGAGLGEVPHAALTGAPGIGV